MDEIEQKTTKRIRDLLDSLEKQSMLASFLFPKHEMRVRLSQDADGELMIPVKSSFGGKTKTKYMFLAYDAGESDPQWKGLILPKTAARAVLNLAVEFSLFSDEGHGLKIYKTGVKVRI